MDQDATGHGARPRPRRLCVRWGPSSPSPKRGRSASKFSAHVYCDQTAGWIKMILGMEVGLSTGDLVVLDGDPAPSQKGAQPPPQFLAHFYCGQTAGCTKMPLGTELSLSPGDFVSNGDLTPSQKGGGAPSPQIFGPCLLWPNSWMDQDNTWHEGRPQPRRPCVVRWGSSPLPERGRSHLPNFWPISIVTKRLGWMQQDATWC